MGFLLIQDTENFDSPNIPITARPSVTPFSYRDSQFNWILDSTRLHEAAQNDNRFWSLSLPWPSTSNPSSGVIWIVIRSDGSIYSGLVPDLVVGPVSLTDLVNSYGWEASPPSVSPVTPSFVPPSTPIYTITRPVGIN